jgi:hypothetical protein
MVWATQLFWGKIVFQTFALFIAQYATATCCRKCILKWHGIGKGRALDPDEVDFILALIMGWIERGSVNLTNKLQQTTRR